MQGATSLEDAAQAILMFNRGIIDAVSDIVPSVKVQIAYYEQYGTAGLRAFYETLRYAKEQGLVVIADCKRNDIGATAAQLFAAAFLGETNVGESTFSASRFRFPHRQRVPGLGRHRALRGALQEARQGHLRARQDEQPLLGRAAGS